MGLIDAFAADERVELKVGDLYDILRVAASNEKKAEYLINAIKCEVPYNYIREIMTGEKEETKADAICIAIPRDIVDAAFEEAKKAAREAAAAAGLDLAAQGANVTVNAEINATHNAVEGLKDCADENVSCEECPKKEVRDAIAEDIAGMADESGQQGDPALPFDTEESEGGEE